MRLAINREFLCRHLFALAVFLALGGWFAYDAFVRYPATPAAELYLSIEKSPPPEGMPPPVLENFKAQKTSTQRMMAALTLAAGLAVAVHLLGVLAAGGTFDESGFSFGGVRRSWDDVKGVDDSKWKKKRIMAVFGDGWRRTLDAWHHTGVDEVRGILSRRGFLKGE